MLQFSFVFSICMVFSCTLASGQITDPSMKRDLQEVSDQIAYDMMRCCSMSGRRPKAMIDWEEARYNRITQWLTIPMTVKWTGSWTGNVYWIKGKLTIGSNGDLKWQKISDSQGFTLGCKDCIIEYYNRH